MLRSPSPVLHTVAGLLLLWSVTMSQIAEDTGIGRATLYKYFAGVEAILLAWHEREVSSHLERLADLQDRAGDPGTRLDAVLEAYALIAFEHHGGEIAALLHRGEHVTRAQQQLSGLIQDLLTEGAQSGGIRDDVSPAELTNYCLHAVTAAGNLPSEAAVRRLLRVIRSGLQPRTASEPPTRS